MNEQEIRAKFAARKCENQIEFDRLMNEMNTEQVMMNHPYLDRVRELTKQRQLLMTQKNAINIQLGSIKVEMLDLGQKQKDLNRLFHELKHNLIVENPREQYANKDNETAA